MIESKQNQYVKIVKELKTKKGRLEHGKLIIEGIKSVNDCLKLGIDCDFILTNSDCDMTFGNIPTFKVAKSIFDDLTSQVTPQGVLGVFKQPQQVFIKPTTDFIVLDGLQDAGNVGTILRTALATGFKRVILIDCVDAFSQKVVSSSMTSIFNLEIQKCKREEFVQLSKEWNLPLYVADLDGVNALQFKAQCGIIGIVIGNEGNGVSNELKSISTAVVTLPMDRNIESLNAAVSAGVLMYVLKNNKE